MAIVWNGVNGVSKHLLIVPVYCRPRYQLGYFKVNFQIYQDYSLGTDAEMNYRCKAGNVSTRCFML